jgi:hypothetical protein
MSAPLSAPPDSRGLPAEPPRWLEAVVYAVFAVVTIGPALGSPDRLAGDGVDLYGTIWFYWWIADCMRELKDPGWTPLFFYPYGKDIFAHTGNNFVDAVIAAPLQWLLGNPGYYKWWVATVFLGNALAFRALAADQIRSRWAAFAATLLFATNPFVVFELQCGRPTQAFLWWLPLAFLGVLRLDRSYKWAIATGVLAALVGWTYWFYGFFFAFACAWLVPYELWTRRRDGKPLVPYLRNLGIAAGVGALLVAPAVAQMWARRAAGKLPGVKEVSRAWFDLPDGVGNSLSAKLHGYLLTEPEGPRFFQHPAWMLILAAVFLFAPRRARWVGVIVVGLLICTGPVQTVFGSDVTFPHYLLLYNAIPFFDRLWFPYRALAICFLGASIGAGLVLERAGEAIAARRPGAWARAGAFGFGMVALSGALLTERFDETWPMVARDVPLPESYRWMSSQGGAIIDLPRGIAQNFIVHQTRHELPLFGGMGENVSLFWPKGYKERTKNPFISALTRAGRDPTRETTFAKKDRDAIVKQGFKWVLLHRELVDSELNGRARDMPEDKRDRAPFAIQDRLTQLLGPPIAVDGPLVVWALTDVAPPPESILPNERTLATRVWERPQPLPYEARLFELGRLK